MASKFKHNYHDEGLSTEQASHAIQSGVLHEHNLGSNDGDKKHLRVGLNMALCHESALASLLIEKGVFTLAEYEERVRLSLNEEVAKYQDRNKPFNFR